MKIADIIMSKVRRFAKGYVFTYVDFLDEVESKEGLIKALNRLAASGEITKLAKGRYYKAEHSPFGELDPELFQVVKDLVERNGKVVGYLTGTSIYNQLGLTTQVSSTIQIGKNEVRAAIKRGKYNISFVKQKNVIIKKNIPTLQLLDTIRFIKKIPDSKIADNCRLIQNMVAALSRKNIELMVRLALKYPPSTRALLGVILSELDMEEVSEKLRKSLNPITTYKIVGVADVFASASQWNIK